MLAFLKVTAVFALIGAGLATSAGAATLQLSTSYTATANPAAPNTFPSDPGGLNGASMKLDFFFADGAIFANGYAPAANATLTVSGATNAASNGTFDILDSVGLFARAGSGGLGRPSVFFGTTNQFAFAVPGIFSGVRFDAGGSVNAANGDLLTLDILQNVSFTFARPTSSSQLSNFNRQQFTATGITVSAQAVGVAPVPLPAGLPLLLAGLCGLALAGRRRRSVAG